MSDDKYGHEEILPSVEFVAADLGRWEDMLTRLGELVDKARKLRERDEDRALDVPGWEYRRAREGNDLPCDSDVCSKRGKGWYTNTEDSGEICDVCFPKMDGIMKRMRMYETENWVGKVKRAEDPKEWVFEPYEGKVTRSDVNCVCMRGEECWFEGNLDRIEEYSGSHVLRGTDGSIGLCDVCMSNGGGDSMVVRRAIRHRYRTENEKQRDILKQVERVRSSVTEEMCETSNWKETQTEMMVGGEWRCSMAKRCVCGSRGGHCRKAWVYWCGYMNVGLCEACWSARLHTNEDLIEVVAFVVAKGRDARDC